MAEAGKTRKRRVKGEVAPAAAPAPAPAAVAAEVAAPEVAAPGMAAEETARDPMTRRLGAETLRSHARRIREGFYTKYLSGEHVLDIGYRGGKADAEAVTEKAIGVELDYPGYDGVHLPFEDFSQDAVFASHCLEHIIDWKTVLADWFRVLRIGGYLVIAVPSQYLYERKADLPSRFNGNHRRFYTPSSLMAEIEAALPLGAWRLRLLRDIDEGFGYGVPPDQHPKGCYEIEMVVERIAQPGYAQRLRLTPQAREAVGFFARMAAQGIAAQEEGRARDVTQIRDLLAGLPLPAVRQLQQHLPAELHAKLLPLLRPVVERAPFDEADYLARYPDIRLKVEEGALPSGHHHYVRSGYFEGRFANPVPPIFL